MGSYSTTKKKNTSTTTSTRDQLHDPHTPYRLGDLLALLEIFHKSLQSQWLMHLHSLCNTSCALVARALALLGTIEVGMSCCMAGVGIMIYIGVRIGVSSA